MISRITSLLLAVMAAWVTWAAPAAAQTALPSAADIGTIGNTDTIPVCPSNACAANGSAPLKRATVPEIATQSDTLAHTFSANNSFTGRNTLPPCKTTLTTGTISIDFNSTSWATTTPCNPETIEVGPLTGNVTLASPTNLPAGGGLWTGFRVVHDANDAFTVMLAAAANYYTPGGQPLAFNGAGGAADYVRCYGFSATELDCTSNGMANFLPLQTIQLLPLGGAGCAAINQCGVIAEPTAGQVTTSYASPSFAGNFSTKLYVIGLTGCRDGGCGPGTGLAQATSVSDGTNSCVAATGAYDNGATSGVATDIWYCANPTVVQNQNYTFTVTWSGPNYAMMSIAAFSGVAASGNDLALGAVNFGTSGTASATTVNSAPNITAGNLIYGICNGGGGTIAPTGASLQINRDSSTQHNLAMYFVASANVSQATIPASQPSGPFACSVAAFK